MKSQAERGRRGLGGPFTKKGLSSSSNTGNSSVERLPRLSIREGVQGEGERVVVALRSDGKGDVGLDERCADGECSASR